MGRGRIHAVNALQYKVSPFIVVDYLFARVNQLLMKLVVGIANDNDGVIEAITFVARNYKNPEIVVAWLQQIECFQPHEFVVKTEFWEKRNVRQFIDLVCRTLSISPPKQVRCVYLDVSLEPCVSAVLNGHMEVEDFLPVCRNLVGQYDEIWNDIISYVESRNGLLASIVVAAAGKGKGKGKGSGKDKVETIAQACSYPFNDVLHALPHEDGVVIDNLERVVEFEQCLQKAEQYAVEVYDSVRVEDVRARASVITFVMKGGIFFVMPRLYPEACKAVGLALKSDRHVVLNFRWTFDQIGFKDSFGFLPKNVICAGDVADEIGCSRKFDAICEWVTGGIFCQRGSWFTDLEEPTKYAFRHRGYRTCVVSKFIADNRNLKEKIEFQAERRPCIPPSRIGRQRDRGESCSREQKKQKPNRESSPEEIDDDNRKREWKNERGVEREGDRKKARDLEDERERRIREEKERERGRKERRREKKEREKREDSLTRRRRKQKERDDDAKARGIVYD